MAHSYSSYVLTVIQNVDTVRLTLHANVIPDMDKLSSNNTSSLGDEL